MNEKVGKLKQIEQDDSKIMEKIQELEKQQESIRQLIEQQISTLSATLVTLQMEISTLAKLMAHRMDHNENRWQEEQSRLAANEESFRLIQSQVCNLPYSQNAITYI